MNLFDNEFDDIIDSETTSSSVSTEMRVNEFKKWKHEVLSLKKRSNVVKEPNDAPRINLLLLTSLFKIYATVINKIKSIIKLITSTKSIYTVTISP